MSPKVKLLVRQAKNDFQFIHDLKENGEKMNTPKWYWGSMERHLFAMVYYGYLVGKGQFDRSLYD